jgi:DivIVA domain-containing protein
MSVDEVRRVLFRTRKGDSAYSEDQVDAFIDRVVEVMASVD